MKFDGLSYEKRVLWCHHTVSPSTPNLTPSPDNGKFKVGKGKKDHEMTVKVGDTVLYGKYSGTDLSIDGTDYLIMKQSDILAII